MSTRVEGGATVTYPETPIPFAIEGPITGEVQVGLGSIWMGRSIGTVESGVYEGTQLIATGNKGAAIAVYVKAGGKSMGTIVIQLNTILTAALGEFERIATEQQQALAIAPDFPVDHEEGE